MGEESAIRLFWNSSSGNSDKLLPTVKITELKKIDQIPKAKLVHRTDLNTELKEQQNDEMNINLDKNIVPKQASN